MQIHLSDISSSEGMRIQKTAEFGMDTITFQSGSFPVLAKEPIELTITNTGDRNLEIRGTGKITVGIPCDRCLEEVSTEIPLEIERKLDMKLTDEDRVNDLDESSYLTGMDLDVDQLVYLEVLMSWPLKVLCREDCKGICSQCGKNLNDGPCGCVEEPKDPRMAAISDIFRLMKGCNIMSICPKNKSSKARRDKRRANWKMSAPNLVKCSKCGELMMPHRVCKACGSYNKKEIIKVED
mgnify:CR=1 FL=1